MTGAGAAHSISPAAPPPNTCPRPERVPGDGDRGDGHRFLRVPPGLRDGDLALRGEGAAWL